MVKIQINGQSFGRIKYVSETLYIYLRNNVSRSHLKDGVLNLSLSRFNHSLKKFNLKYDIELDQIKPIFNIKENFL